jgi:DNA polymerase-3 subunit delta
MKLAYPQLEQHLKKNLASVYVINSDELLLVQEAIKAIQDAAKLAGFTEYHSITPEPRCDLASLLYTDTRTISLFANKKIIILHLHQHKLTSIQGKLLADYAAKSVQDTILIIHTGKLDTKTMRAAWCLAIERTSIILAITSILAEQLPAWLIQRAKQVEMQLTPAAAKLLARLTENNSLAAGQAIEKLNLLYAGKIVDEEAIKTCISDTAHFDIFNLVDNAIQGNAADSLRILRHLIEEGIEPILILWALVREIRLLAELRSALKKELNPEKAFAILFEKHRVWGKRQLHFKNHLKNHTQIHYWQLLTQAARVDRVIKGVEKGKIEDELEKIMILLATKHHPKMVDYMSLI